MTSQCSYLVKYFWYYVYVLRKMSVVSWASFGQEVGLETLGGPSLNHPVILGVKICEADNFC